MEAQDEIEMVKKKGFKPSIEQDSLKLENDKLRRELESKER